MDKLFNQGKIFLSEFTTIPFQNYKDASLNINFLEALRLNLSERKLKIFERERER